MCQEPDECVIIVFKMAFEESLVLLLLIWLRSRRVRRVRARRRRTAAIRRLHFTLLELQRQTMLCVTLAVARQLLDATRVERTRWVQHKSTAFFTDIIPGWDDALFKQNFRVSRGTFMYLHGQLRADLDKVDFLRRPILADKRLAIALWRLRTNVEYRTISHLFGVGISTVCVIVHQVCDVIVRILTPKYVKMPQGEELETVVNGFQH